jgi:alanine-glyoxylate transaminase/serine-glyoxylate transaminase/serine-pyruvate transaminase
VSPRALDAIRSRRSACPSWYFDLSLIAEYWAEAKRAYHHTAPISMLYGLREALRLVLDEGLAERYARHRANSDALLAGLHALGLTPLPAATHRLASLNCVTLPSAVDDRLVRSTLLEEYGIEIGGGLGALQGRVWRIGLMGESSRRAHVYALLDALEAIFVRQGWITTRGDALASAAAVYESRRAVEAVEDT